MHIDIDDIKHIHLSSTTLEKYVGLHNRADAAKDELLNFYRECFCCFSDKYDETMHEKVLTEFHYASQNLEHFLKDEVHK